MRVCTVRRAEPKEDLWRVEVENWQSDVKPGQLLEQVRGPNDAQVTIWDVLAEEDENTLILGPLRPTDREVKILPGDGLDACVGGLASHLGLGDVIAFLTKSVGIQPCLACEERRQKLNRLFPNVLRR